MFERGKREDSELGQGFSGTDTPRGNSTTRPASAGESAVIGRSIHIDGDLRGEEDLRIEGDVSGTIQLRNNNLTVGQDGKIKADLYAKSIVVDGTVDGDLYGSERVSIRKNAHVQGNVTSPRVSLEEGARFKGSIEMDAQAVEAALGKSSSKVVDAKPKAVADSPREAAASTSAAKSVG